MYDEEYVNPDAKSCREFMHDEIFKALDKFMYAWGDYIEDEHQLRLFIKDAVDTYLRDFEW